MSGGRNSNIYTKVNSVLVLGRQFRFNMRLKDDVELFVIASRHAGPRGIIGFRVMPKKINGKSETQ